MHRICTQWSSHRWRDALDTGRILCRKSTSHIPTAATLVAVPEAIAIMLQVLDALASAHKQGVIHQDIKPGNIMLAPKTG